ncbi:MAG TPA: hypothetical protein VF619_06915 [Allosphingosinicella sp.]
MVAIAAMAQEKLSGALDRIERALARIEAAATRIPDASGEGGAELDGLRQAHEALRGKVQGAIHQIDRLLELEDSN